MAIPECVLNLINEEQQRQEGSFVPGGSEYLEKLGRYAELFVEYDSTGISGFVFFYCNAPDQEFSYITLIATAPHVRGEGIGYRLLDHVLAVSIQRGFASCRLEVRKANRRALAFYKRAGFVSIEDRGGSLLMSLPVK